MQACTDGAAGSASRGAQPHVRVLIVSAKLLKRVFSGKVSERFTAVHIGAGTTESTNGITCVDNAGFPCLLTRRVQGKRRSGMNACSRRSRAGLQ